MNPRFHCSLRTTASLYGDPEVFARMWSLLAEPEVGAATYDLGERNHAHRFTPDPTEAYALFEDNGYLTVGGRRDGFLLCLSCGGGAGMSMWFDESVDGSRWLPWIVRMIDAMPVVFGACYSRAEYDAKHRVVRELPGGGSSVGAVGMSDAEFKKYLPGLYWLTIFGPELAAALDFSGLSHLPVTVIALPHGSRLLQIDEPLVPDDMTKRLELQARIADVLGARYFFDRNRPDLTFEHPPAFQAWLARPR